MCYRLYVLVLINLDVLILMNNNKVSVIKYVGNVIIKFVLNLFLSIIFCVWVVVIVVFDIKDRLLLNIVLFIIMLRVNLMGNFKLVVKLVLMGERVVMVFMEVFIVKEIK